MTQADHATSENPRFDGIAHLDLSVSDVEKSADWYVEVLGLRRARRVDFDDRIMIVLVHRPTRLIIGLNQHAPNPDPAFDERRSGLDHVGFRVTERAELDRWQKRFAELGVEHSSVTDTEHGSALVFRDLDNIQLELWWDKPR